MQEKFLNHEFQINDGPGREELKDGYFDQELLNFSIFEDVQSKQELGIGLLVDFMTIVDEDGLIHELRGPAGKDEEFDFVAKYNLETRKGRIEFYRPDKEEA